MITIRTNRGERLDLSLVDPKTGVGYEADFVGNHGGFEPGGLFRCDDGTYVATAETADYWAARIAEMQALDDSAAAAFATLGDDAAEELHAAIAAIADRGLDLEEELDALQSAVAEALAAEEGAAWMEGVLIDADDADEDGWLSMEWPEFTQALSNANAPAFPSFETASETDAAFTAAWDEARRIEASRR